MFNLPGQNSTKQNHFTQISTSRRSLFASASAPFRLFKADSSRGEAKEVEEDTRMLTYHVFTCTSTVLQSNQQLK